MSIVWKQNKIWISFLVCMALIIGAISLTRSYLNVDVEASVEVPDSSFATMSSAAARAFGEALTLDYTHINGPTSKLGLVVGGSFSDRSAEEITAVNISNFMKCVALLGYSDIQIQTGTTQSIASTLSNNVVSYSFENTEMSLVYEPALSDSADGSDVLSSGLSFGSLYVGLGNMLQDLGFDEVKEQGVTDPMRRPIGTLFTMIYVLSGGVDLFWEYVIKFLQFVDPFRVFSTVKLDTSGVDRVSSYIANGLNMLSSACGKVYDTLQERAFTLTIPLFTAFAIFSWLVINKGDKFVKTLKDLIIRVVYVSVGVPLLLAVYSTTVGFVANYTLGRVSPTSEIILSLFFDFNEFALSSNMNMRNDAWQEFSYNADSRMVNYQSYNHVREVCLKTSIFGKVIDSNLISATVTNNDHVGFTGWDLYVADKRSSSTGDVLSVERTDDGSGGDNKKAIMITDYVVDLLKRYQSGTVTLSSMIESKVLSSFYTDVDSGAIDATGHIAFLLQCGLSDDYTEFITLNEKAYSISTAYKSHTIRVRDGNKFDVTEANAKSYATNRWKTTDAFINASGHGSSSAPSSYHIPDKYNLWGYCSLVPVLSMSDRTTLIGKNVSYTSNSDNIPGLSHIGMYNYLNSKFEPGRVNVCSSVNSTTDAAVYSHYSVTIVGSGIMRFVFVAVSICSICAFVVLGYAYGFGILVASVRALFKMIPSVFSGMMGIMRGIGSTIVLTFALIGEILGTCIMYSIASDLLRIVYALIEEPVVYLFGFLFQDSSGGSGMTNAYFMIPMQGIISVVVTVFMVKKMMDWRYGICQAIAEFATEIVGKFLDTKLAAPDLGARPGSLGELATVGAMGLGALSIGAEKAGYKSIGDAMGLGETSSDASMHGDENAKSDAALARFHDELGGMTDNGEGFGEAQAKERAEHKAAQENAANIASDRDAGKYVDENKEKFLEDTESSGSSGKSGSGSGGDNTDTSEPTSGSGSSSVNLSKSGSGSDVTITGDGNTPRISFAGNESGEIVDAEGNTGRIVNAKTGQPYTEEDRAKGEAYSVVGADGKPITSSTGQQLSNMSADSLVQYSNGAIGIGTEGGNAVFAPIPDPAAAVSGQGSTEFTTAPGGTTGGTSTGGYSGSASDDGGSSGNTSGSNGSSGSTGDYGNAGSGTSPQGTYFMSGTGASDGQVTISPVVAAAAGYTIGAMSYGANPVEAVSGAATASTVLGSMTGINMTNTAPMSGIPVMGVPVAGGETSTTVSQNTTVIQGGEGTNTTVMTGSGDGGSVLRGDAATNVVNTNGGNATVIDMDVQQTVNQTAVSESVNSENNTTNKSNNSSANMNVSDNSKKSSENKSKDDDSGVDDIMANAADATGKLFKTFGNIANSVIQAARDKNDGGNSGSSHDGKHR